MIRRLCIATGLVLTCAVTAAAHEKGVIRLGSKTAGVGSELLVSGERLPKNATLRLELRGALATYPLGTLSTNPAGVVRTNIVLPAQARPGSYAVVAIASDGEVVGRAELAITPVSPQAPAEHPSTGLAHEMPTIGTTGVPQATAEMMPVPVNVTPAQRVIIGTLIVLSALAGLALLRRPSGGEL